MDIEEPLGPAELVRLLYKLGLAQATGVLDVTAAVPRHLVLRRGALITTDVQRARALLACLVAQQPCRARFEGGVAVYPPGGRQRPLPLGPWAREHLERQVDGATARALAAQLAGARLAVRHERAPDPAWCDDTDRRILAALSTPQRLEQLVTGARAPRFRLACFLYFLRHVGALRVEGVVVAAPAPERRAAEQQLGLPAGADRDATRRAYRRLARALHPDLNSEVSSERRADLERTLAAVTCAYRRLTRPGTI